MPARADCQARTKMRDVVDGADVETVDVHMRRIRDNFQSQRSVCRLRCLWSRQREHRLDERRFCRRFDSSRRLGYGYELLLPDVVVRNLRIAAVRETPPPIRQASPAQTSTHERSRIETGSVRTSRSSGQELTGFNTSGLPATACGAAAATAF